MTIKAWIIEVTKRKYDKTIHFILVIRVRVQLQWYM